MQIAVDLKAFKDTGHNLLLANISDLTKEFSDDGKYQIIQPINTNSAGIKLKTFLGKYIDFFITKEIPFPNENGKVQYWILKPTKEAIKLVPQCRVYTIHLYNE
jgi:hypothetical protein